MYDNNLYNKSSLYKGATPPLPVMYYIIKVHYIINHV